MLLGAFEKRIRSPLLIFPILLLVGACCGTRAYDAASLPNEVSFDLTLPVEAVISTDRNEVRLPASITNTSTDSICIARRNGNNWVGGMRPNIAVEVRSAPVQIESADFVISGLEGKTLARGRSYKNLEDLFLRIRPKQGIPQGHSGTMSLELILTHPKTNVSATTGKIPIDISTRRPGLPALISEPLTFNSE